MLSGKEIYYIRQFVILQCIRSLSSVMRIPAQKATSVTLNFHSGRKFYLSNNTRGYGTMFSLKSKTRKEKF